MATLGASSETGASISISPSSYCCTSAIATNVLLMDPARKCVSAVTGVRWSRSAMPIPPGPFHAPGPHQRDARARHAGLVEDSRRVAP